MNLGSPLQYKNNFTHYRNRFSNMELGVGQTSGSDTSLWYVSIICLVYVREIMGYLVS